MGTAILPRGLKLHRSQKADRCVLRELLRGQDEDDEGRVRSLEVHSEQVRYGSSNDCI